LPILKTTIEVFFRPLPGQPPSEGAVVVDVDVDVVIMEAVDGPLHARPRPNRNPEMIDLEVLVTSCARKIKQDLVLQRNTTQCRRHSLILRR
jgi:hypothetical protein